MGLLDRMREGYRAFRGAGGLVLDGTVLPDDAVRAVELRREAISQALAATKTTQESMMGTGVGLGLSLDTDDYQYRRLTGGGPRNQRRDLAPLQQDKMLEIAWYLWEQNPFARRLITVMTDLILGEGVTVQATDARLQQQIDLTWGHRINQIRTRIREFYVALALNGELILPLEVNPFTGRPTFGYIDPWQVHHIEHAPGNVLLPTHVVLKPEPGQQEGQRLKIVQEDESGRLDGEVVYFGINRLPNSTRGRSDLLPLADWLDLYDQYMFSEVERLHLLSAFVWDYKIEGAQSDAQINEKLKKLGTPKPGTVFGHNEKESLEAKTPALQAADRSEVARMLRVHIAGSMGFPITYFGDTDSNRATIEGQNDITLKTPAARQKEFAQFLNIIVRLAIDGPTRKNPALFSEADQGWVIKMPEIAAKDIARVGTVMANVIGGLDVAMNNRTMSRRVAVTTTLALLKHLGVDAEPQDVMDDADQEAEDRQDQADAIQAAMAATRDAARPFGQPAAAGAAVADDGDDTND